jgi:hypothetical protein
MPRWSQIEQDAPALAERARSIFDAHKHKTIATLRADGSPRISGTEADFWEGDLWWGSMADARKGADLKRDARFALHSATVDPELTLGDAKIAGRAVVVTGPAFDAYVAHLSDEAEPDEPVPEDAFDLFRADISEIVVIRIGEPADHLVIESWHEGTGYTSVKRH